MFKIPNPKMLLRKILVMILEHWLSALQDQLPPRT